MMLRTRALFVLLAAAGTVAAWSSPKLACVVNSAAAPGATVTIHADVLGPFDHPDLFTAWLHYSTDNQATWNRVEMAAVGEPGFDSTFAGTFTAPASGTVWYRVAAEDTFGRAFHSPLNQGNAWPVPMNLLGPTSDEPTGDCINSPDGPFLDLTGCWMSYSGTHFYARLTNNDDEWPFRRGILGPWYIYAAGFRNPDAPQDTWTFAMAYANIPLVGGPGLYQVNAYTSDYERFADIDYQLNGNELQMRCLAADLTSNPNFGPWPNTSGYLRAARGDTRSADALMNNYLHDTTNQSRWYVDRAPRFTVSQNQPPVLVRPRVLPQQGTPETDFYFDVQYADPDSNLPVVRAVVIDDADTLRLRPNSHNYWTNVLYSGNRSGFAPGTHVARFTFNDGIATVTASDTFVVNDTTALAEVPGPADPGQLAAAPNPFTARVELNVPGTAGGLEVRDCLGRLVRRFAAGLRHGWDGTGEDGRLLPAGVYLLCPVERAACPPLRLVRLDR